MSVNPLQVPRVTMNLRTQTLLAQLRTNQLRIFQQQQRIATGQNLLAPSDDPVTASRIFRLSDRFSRQDQILTNLEHADRWLSAADASVSDIGSLLTQARTIASEQVSNTQSADQRASAALVIDSLIDRLTAVGNQQFEGRYLFGGQRSAAAPFESILGRTTYVGDPNTRNTEIDSGLERPFNVTADQLFGLNANTIRGFADLNPAITPTTRLSDLGGALGAGIRSGAFRVTQIGGAGAGTFDVDTTGVDTVGDLVAKFNGAAAAAGVGLTASLTANGLQISGPAGSQVQVSAVGSSTTAADLGILGTSAVGSPLVGQDVNPRLTVTTPLSALLGGSGLSLPSGVQVINGGTTTSVSFAGATTIQDVLNRLNGAGAGIRATINAAGNGIDVLNQIAGSDLYIGENGGSDATALGIRTLHAGTKLSTLNGGKGVRTVSGPDLHIIDANGVAFDVDLDGSVTLQDVINKINTAATAAGSALSAGLTPTGNGLRLSQAAGTQNIQVQRGGLSGAADDLGLLKSGSTSVLDGDDVNPVRQGGVFDALHRLADALRVDNTQGITAAGEQLESVIRGVIEQQGRIGARAQALQQQIDHTQDAVLATKRFLSDLQDADLTDAVTRFQQAQLALEASLRTGSSLLNQSLLDFLK